MQGFKLLGKSLSLSWKELVGLLEDSSRQALVGSSVSGGGETNLLDIIYLLSDGLSLWFHVSVW